MKSKKQEQTDTEKRFYFRLQYQKGKDIITAEVIEGKGYLPISKMMETILAFVMKVIKERGGDVGGKIALQGLKLIFRLFNQVETDWNGDGQSVSHKLNFKTAKDKEGRSERFDVEFLGIGGRDDESNELISKLIQTYKEMVRDGRIQK